MGNYNQIDGIIEVPHDKGTIKLKRRIRNKVKCDFEDWMELQARKRPYALKDKLQPEEYRESMDAVARLAASGGLNWGGPAMQAALAGLPGIVKLISLLAQDAGDRATESDILHLMQTTEAIEKREDSWVIVSIETGEPISVHPTERDAKNSLKKLPDLVGALNQIIESNKANFLDPPVRGMVEI